MAKPVISLPPDLEDSVVLRRVLSKLLEKIAQLETRIEELENVSSN